MQKQNSNDFISVRIRKELSKQEQNISEKIYLTYKQKELKNTSDGTKIEVNNEKECELSNSETVISFLLDTGFCEYLSKSKTVEKFSYQTPSGIATIEICTIPPIGDFIEIEIVYSSVYFFPISIINFHENKFIFFYHESKYFLLSLLIIIKYYTNYF